MLRLMSPFKLPMNREIEKLEPLSRLLTWSQFLRTPSTFNIRPQRVCCFILIKFCVYKILSKVIHNFGKKRLSKFIVEL